MLDNPQPNQRLRFNQEQTDVPIDKSLIRSYVFRIREIMLRDLLNEDAEKIFNLFRMYLKVQILRIITPQAENAGNAFTRYQRGSQQQRVNFIRILLCRNKSKLCYLMITNDQNKRIFHRDLMLRENGNITVGSFFRVIAPYAVERNMQGIPLVKLHYPAIVLESPVELPTIVINRYIQAKESSVAMLKNVDVEVNVPHQCK